jgi:hypothetical protein
VIGWLQSSAMDTHADWDAETVEDALAVLEDLLDWELAPPRWERAAGMLATISAALAADDPEALREAVADLELGGPTRILRIGSKTTTGIPDQILDLRNVLVHSLTERQAGPKPGPDGAKEDTDGRRPR